MLSRRRHSTSSGVQSFPVGFAEGPQFFVDERGQSTVFFSGAPDDLRRPHTLAAMIEPRGVTNLAHFAGWGLRANFFFQLRRKQRGKRSACEVMQNSSARSMFALTERGCSKSTTEAFTNLLSSLNADVYRFEVKVYACVVNSRDIEQLHS